MQHLKWKGLSLQDMQVCHLELLLALVELKWLLFWFCVCSEMCGDVDSLELGDTVEYTLSKGKGNKVSAEKVTKVTPGKDRLKLVCSFLLFCFLYHIQCVEPYWLLHIFIILCIAWSVFLSCFTCVLTSLLCWCLCPHSERYWGGRGHNSVSG